jgi:N-acetylmuramate 1-kinase
VAEGVTTVDEEDALRELVRRALGADVVRVEPVAAGLGHRRFLRLHLEPARPATLVARIDPAAPGPPGAGEPALEPLRGFLEAQGLPVPRRFGGDPARGIDLLEDLGAVSLERALRTAEPLERRALYQEACSLVARLQRLVDPDGRVPAFGRRLDATLVAAKAERFVRSSLPAGLGRAPRPAEAAVVRDAFVPIAEAVEEAPRRLAHRDFQSANLMLRAGARSGFRLAMVDIQGAFLAPPEYDLVCLLRDSYVVVDPEEARTHAERTRPALPDAPDRETFRRRFDLLTLARKSKDHALFFETAARGDRSWLRFAAPTLRYLVEASVRVAPLDARLARFAALLASLGPGAAPCER